MEEVFLQLEHANVNLYPVLVGSETRANPWGQADTDNPVFLGCEADGVKLAKRPVQVRRFPTGRRHPVMKTVYCEHSIQISRLWLCDVKAGNLRDFDPDPNDQFIMVFAWQQPAPLPVEQSRWKSRTYYGVKLASWDLTSDDTITFNGEQSFTAEFYRNASGTGLIQ